MAKSKWGENPRATEARERKETKKQVERTRKDKAVEDVKWVENDSKVWFLLNHNETKSNVINFDYWVLPIHIRFSENLNGKRTKNVSMRSNSLANVKMRAWRRRR